MSSLKDKIHQGDPVFGGRTLTGNPAVAEIMAAEGFDFLAADMEHPPITSWSSFYDALAVGELPGWLVGAVLGVTVLSSAFLCWYAASRSDGEITDLRGSHREQWRI
jgi:hypothetical protein